MGNAISWDLAQKLGISRQDIEQDPEFQLINTAKKKAALRVLGRPRKKLALRIGGLQTTFKIKPLVVEGLAMSFNLSGPFMSQQGIDQLHSRNSLKLQGREIPLVNSKQLGGQMATTNKISSMVYVAQDTTVPPRSAVFLPIRVPDVERGQRQAGDVTLEPHAHFVSHTDLHPALGAISCIEPNGQGWTTVMNTKEEGVLVPKGLRFGEALDFKEDPPRIASLGIDAQSAERSDEWYIKEFSLDQAPALQRPEDLKRAIDLLREFDDLFSSNDDYGRTTLVEHEIHTTPGPAIKCKNRPINPRLEDNLKQQLQHWLDQDVVEPSSSPWSFPLLAVPKKNGKIRWCCDYRGLNARTIKDAFPLPNIEDNLARLANSTIFSGIDGTGAYHVVSIKAEDREKTAFATPWGLYHFKQMPFGLCNAPATYCRLVQKVLDGIPLSVAIPYLDDTCIHSSNLDEHLQGLRRVFEAHRAAGLTLQPSKCQLFQKQIEYLGHQISAAGITVPEKYIDIVTKWPEPQSVKDVRVFVGKMSYYRRFIPKFSAIAAPLTDLIKQEKEEEGFQMNDKARSAFWTLKENLAKSPVLAYPRFDSDQPFILDTDWSHEPGAIGAVLSQVQDGEERVLAYGARKLNKAEANYSSHKGELLSVIYFLRLWKYYLSHRPFILRTDHEALKWIRKMEEPKGMILRWLETLAHFDFTIQFRPGKKHANADALSRVEHARPLDTSDLLDENIAEGFAALSLMEGKRDELLQAQREDDDLATVRTWIETGSWPTSKEAKMFGRDLRAYHAIGPTLMIDDEGVIVKTEEPSFHRQEKRVCVPATLRTKLMRQIHEEHGHRGHNNTFEQFARRFYCPGMSVEARLVVQMCEICQKNQPAKAAQKHTLMSTLTGVPFNRWSIDFVGPLPTSDNGNSYILTAKDCFTRWIEAFPTSDMTAATVARLLHKEIFCRYGIPEHIHSDQGTQFTSEKMRAVYDALGIHGTHTPAYNPKSNPVERTHRDLGRLLRASIDEHPDDWEKYLPDCLLALRITQNRSTGFSPFFMVYGQECVMPVDVIYGRAPGQNLSPVAHAQQLRHRLEAVHRVARENQALAVERSKQNYRNRLQGGPLQVGDRVWLFTPRTTARSRKLQIRWTGPWEVIKVVSPVLFTISSGNWNVNKIDLTVALDRLKRYFGRGEALEQLHDLTREDVDLADEEVEVGETPSAPQQEQEDAEGGGDAPVVISAAGGGGGPGPGPPPRGPSPEWGEDGEERLQFNDTMPSAAADPEPMDTPQTPSSPWSPAFRDDSMPSRPESMEASRDGSQQKQITSTPNWLVPTREMDDANEDHFFGFSKEETEAAARSFQRRHYPMLPTLEEEERNLQLMETDALREWTKRGDGAAAAAHDSFGPLPVALRDLPQPLLPTAPPLSPNRSLQIKTATPSVVEPSSPGSARPLALPAPPARLALPAPSHSYWTRAKRAAPSTPASTAPLPKKGPAADQRKKKKSP